MQWQLPYTSLTLPTPCSGVHTRLFWPAGCVFSVCGRGPASTGRPKALASTTLTQNVRATTYTMTHACIPMDGWQGKEHIKWCRFAD